MPTTGGPQWFPETFDYQKRPDALWWAWNVTASTLNSYDEAYYTVGYRGAGDEAAPCDGHCTLKDKAEHVSWALNNQTAMLKRINPNAQPYTWLWSEGLSYLEAGYLKIPNGTTVIFTDQGDGQIHGLEYATSGAGICEAVGGGVWCGNLN